MYGKMFRQMYHGTLATTGPWQALVTFQQFIVLADKEGIVDMTAEAISRETTIPLEIIRLGVAALEMPDKGSRSPDLEGRRIVRLSENREWGWRVVNYVHYRNLKREEDRREYHRQYWHKRKLNKASTPLNTTQPTQPNQPIADADADADAEKIKIKNPPLASASSPPKGGNARPTPARRLPKDFGLTLERQTMAEAEKLDPEREFAAFTDYWRSASGARARKHDWDATWRNWCRRAGDFKSRTASTEPVLTWRPGPDD